MGGSKRKRPAVVSNVLVGNGHSEGSHYTDHHGNSHATTSNASNAYTSRIPIVYSPRFAADISDLAIADKNTRDALAYLARKRLIKMSALIPCDRPVSDEELASMGRKGQHAGQEEALVNPRGWSISTGGGMHHACWATGKAMCFFADLTLAVRHAQALRPGIRIMIVDLDAHRGNGYEADLMKDSDAGSVYILDVFNTGVYPPPSEAPSKRAIRKAVPMDADTSDRTYLTAARRALDEAFLEFPDPGLVLYVNGFDVLKGDKNGHLGLTPNGVVRRDIMVFEAALSRRIPICVVIAGGSYMEDNGEVIGDIMAKVLRRCKLL
eukprot:CAMPEP_0196653404 /NCGR_PEP_ID=MMETSP1086-20130531/3031_1 /TAXON_ID=77921 /ORGANISM="Cyanoptyche  gloeocystis , Strain SAG4.97" /LENGTH=322 /DNA_ID=CAMNT_0041984587 /DNA_START=54 /DNA_END=1023 /DNA_ORIENTATION=-